MKSAVCSVWAQALLLTFVFASQGADFYVAPSAVPRGNGSLNTPWDLQTALNQPPDVHPGDTIWLRGGVHRLSNRPTRFLSSLQGSASVPIIVRQYPGERASIDGVIQQVHGGNVIFRDLEVYNSMTNRYTTETGPFPRAWWVKYDGVDVDLCLSGVDVKAPNVKLINLVVHDSIGGGIGINIEAGDAEIYGCLAYYNGWQASDRAHGHGIYGQNALPTFKTIKDCLIFENLALGLQVSGTGPGPIADGFRVEGSAFFMNGVLAFEHQANLLIGAFQGVGRDCSVISNCIYDAFYTMSDCNLGYSGGLGGLTVRDNYFGTSVLFGSNYNMTIEGNTFASTIYNLNTNAFLKNTYGAPSTNTIIIRPNGYENGRASIVIYNLQKLDWVEADVSAAGLLPGEQYELHNAADYYGDVVSGIYSNAPIRIPMTGHTVARPFGTNLRLPPSTFPGFGAFVLKSKDRVVTVPGPPYISAITNRIIAENSSTGPIRFAVASRRGSASSVQVQAKSSSPALVPQANISIGGSNENRTVSVVPMQNQSGTALITLIANDGFNTTRSSFRVTILEPPVISAIPNQTVSAGSLTVPFTVSAAETWARDLSVSAVAEDAALIPTASLKIEGLDSARNLVITPVPGRSGVTKITVKVSDVVSTVSQTFQLTVK